jgi:hypothetical protein
MLTDMGWDLSAAPRGVNPASDQIAAGEEGKFESLAYWGVANADYAMSASDGASLSAAMASIATGFRHQPALSVVVTATTSELASHTLQAAVDTDVVPLSRIPGRLDPRDASEVEKSAAQQAIDLALSDPDIDWLAPHDDQRPLT